MKQFEILNGRCLVVELPRGVKFPRIETNQAVIPYGQDLTWDINGGEKSYEMDETEWVSLPPGNWRIIGTLSEVTEEQAFDIVDHYHVSDNMDLTATYAFKDYVDGEDEFLEDYWDEYALYTALESLWSAIEAEGYYLDVNPLGSVPECGCTGPSDKGACDGCDEFMDKQSRVLDRSRCLLLGREGT